MYYYADLDTGIYAFSSRTRVLETGYIETEVAPQTGLSRWDGSEWIPLNEEEVQTEIVDNESEPPEPQKSDPLLTPASTVKNSLVVWDSILGKQIKDCSVGYNPSTPKLPLTIDEKPLDLNAFLERDASDGQMVVYRDRSFKPEAIPDYQAFSDRLARAEENTNTNSNTITSLIGQWNSILATVNGRIQALEDAVAIDTYGEQAYIDDELRMVLATQLRFEGGGVSSGRVSGYFRRFNGATMTNKRGLFSGNGWIITSFEFTCEKSITNQTVQLRHYDPDGNDPQVIDVVPVDRENNRYALRENVRLFVPPSRRFVPWMTQTFAYPQYRLTYRKVLAYLQ